MIIKAYDEIEELYGLDDAKDLMRQYWQVLAEFKGKKEEMFTLLPDLFLISSFGSGTSNFVNLLGEYLFNTGKVPFYGDVKSFEFSLSYLSSDLEMNEIRRFATQLKNSAGFRSQYKGVVSIDITAWKKCMHENNFLLFLKFLSHIDADVCIVFIAKDFDEEEVKDAEKVLSSFCRIRSVSFAYPDSEKFTEYCSKRVATYGLYLDESTNSLINESINTLMKSQFFNGYKTINRLCLDIVFELIPNKNIKNSIVLPEHLHDFTKNSYFIERLCATKELARIGFGGKV